MLKRKERDDTVRRRITAVLIAIILMVSLRPFPVLANGAVTLYNISDKKPGEEVIISGTTTLDEVTVKVLRPNNTVLYVNVLKGSPFEDKFTLPEDAIEGTYTVIVGEGSTIDTKTFKVTKPSEIIKVTGVTLDKTSLSLEVGSTYRLTATVYPDNATNKNVTWTSSNSNIATVDDGLVTAKAAGIAIITVTTEDGGKTASCTVTVAPKSSGGGGGGGGTSQQTPAIQQGPGKLQSDGSVLIETQSILEKETGLAYASVSKETIQKAIEQAIEDETGIKKIIIKIPELKDTTGYVVELPSETLSYNSNIKIEINTPKGNMAVPGNMFRSGDLEGSTVRLGIRSVQNIELKEDLRQNIGTRPIVELQAESNGKKINWNNPNAPITVEINYKPTQEELQDYEHIVVWHIDNNGNIAPVPSGRYNPAMGKVIFTTTHFSSYAVTFVKKTFNDIQNYPWARKQIEVMASKGIINGTTTTTYSPQNNITRADFMMLLIKTLGLTAEIDSNFADVKPTDYYYEAVGIAKKLGIATGTGDNRFNPRVQISRQDMMVLVERALKVAKKISTTGTMSDLSSFVDASQVSGYAVEGVATLIKEGIIQGSGNMINPRGNATRAETAVIIYRIYNKYIVK